MSKRRFADRSAADLAWQPPASSTPADLTRLAVDACLGPAPLADREWNLLETLGWAAEIKQRRRTPEQAAALVEQWREAVAGPSPRIHPHSVPASSRAEAVAFLIAVEARKTEPVIEFRRRILHGKLVPADQLDRWLGILAKRQEAKPWVKVYASAEEVEVGVVPLGTSNLVTYGYDVLEYAVPGTGQLRRILVSSKGILGWLRWLSQWLSERFRWRMSDAATFVLSDVPPPITESDHQVDSQRAVPALTRVVMTIDPTMSPREVATLYRKIRFQYFGRRHRSMTPKHVELGKFWAAQNEGAAWKELMAQWNERQPRWAYKREQNFARDCEQARERLLGQNVAGNAGKRSDS
ncbi:MAG: hypothetical protein NTW28_35345 [Candidatus Solibacter sp.]|nr:hypothetical protein [Candidatus Solibacter sp.]